MTSEEIDMLKPGDRIKTIDGKTWTYRGRVPSGGVWLEPHPTRGMLQRPTTFLADAERVHG